MSNSEAKQGLEFWVQWQVLVCALVNVGPGIYALYFIKKAKSEPLMYSDLCGSRWRNLNPLWLLVYRGLAFVCLAQLLYDVFAMHGPFVFYFYTQWTLALVVVYFGLGTIVSAYGYWQPSKTPSQIQEETKFVETKGDTKLQRLHYEQELHQKAGILGNLMHVAYLTSAGAVMLTDLVFWFILVPFLTDDNFRVDLVMILIHSLNAVFLLLDTALNRLPFSWFGFAYFAVWSSIYIIFHWVIHACGATWWPYPFLELNTPWAPLWYISLALIHIPCYGLYALIESLKYSLLPRAKNYVRCEDSTRPNTLDVEEKPTTLDVWVDVEYFTSTEKKAKVQYII